MHKLFWLDDGEVCSHPIASLLNEDLKKLNVEIIYRTADSFENQKPTFSASRKLQEVQELYLIRRNKRKVKLQKGFAYFNLKSKKVRNRLIFFVRIVNNLDKIYTKNVTSRIAKIRDYWKGYYNSIISHNDCNTILFSRAYFIPLVLIKKIINYRKNLIIVYYPFELYGNQFGFRYSKTILLVEKIFLKWSNFILITQNDLRAKYYRDIGFAGDLYIVRNYKRFQKFKTDERNTRKNLGIRVAVIGTIGLGRNIEYILKWIEDKRIPISIDVFGTANKAWRIHHEELLNSAKANRVLRMNAEVNVSRLSELLIEFDCGLIAYDRSCLNHLYCAPAKLTDYLHAGLPVLAVDMPAMKYYADKYEYVSLFKEDDFDSFEKALQRIMAYFSVECKEKIASETKCLDWNMEFQKIKHIFLR